MLSCYHHFHDHQFLPLASPHSHLGNYIRTRLAKQHTQTTDKTLGQTKIHVGSPDRETERESERGTRTEFVTRTPQRQFFYGDNLNSQVFFSVCMFPFVCLIARHVLFVIHDEPYMSAHENILFTPYIQLKLKLARDGTFILYVGF